MGCGSSENTRRLGKDSIKTYKEFFQALAQGQQLVGLDNSVLDIAAFAALHPGGDSILKYYIGMEISRFFYGGFQHPQAQVHTHSESAIKMLKNMTVGTIEEDFRSRIFIPKKLNAKIDSEKWKLVSKKMLTAVHGVFEFHSDNFEVTAMLPYFDHCGKYYTLYSQDLKMGRNLACIFTPGAKILSHYLDLLKAFKENTDYVTPFPDINGVRKEHLELYLKKMNTFSTFLHDFPIGKEKDKGYVNEFTVKGPFGPGLQVTGNEKGTMIGMACGTGVVLFLDLAMYMLRMHVYNIGKKKGKTYKIFGNETFDRLTDPGFKLCVFSAFKRDDHVLGKPLFEALHDISNSFKLNCFEYHLRISDSKNSSPWDEAFMKKHIDLNAKKIIVYGPSGAEESLKGTLKKIGIKDEQFHRI